MKSLHLLPLLAVVLVALPIESRAITITYNYTETWISGADGQDRESYTGTTIPASVAAVNAAGGSHYANNALSYTASGQAATLSNVFQFSRDGALGYNSFATLFIRMDFVATADTTIAISGAMNMHDATSPGEALFYAYLSDYSYVSGPPPASLRSEQISTNTLNQSFVFGGMAGDYSNMLGGSLTGDLTTGHLYQLTLYAVSEAYPDVDGGATADGFMQIDIGGGVHGVPDTANTLTLIGVALAGLAAFRRSARTG